MEVKQHPVWRGSRPICVISSRWAHHYIASIVCYNMNLVLRSSIQPALRRHSSLCLSLRCIVVSLKCILVVLVLLLSWRMHVSIWWLSYNTSLLQLMILILRNLARWYPKTCLSDTCSRATLHLRTSNPVFVPCTGIIGSSRSHVTCVITWSYCSSCTEMLLCLVHHVMLLKLIVHWRNDLFNIGMDIKILR